MPRAPLSAYDRLFLAGHNVLQRRGLMTSAAQRKPGGSLSAVARDEVEFLLRRLARHDPRARF
jgi:4-hydroxy-tetrahydrodipicolinate synthase